MNTSKQVKFPRRKEYIAVGAIRGQYQPSTDIFTQGILLADDGTEFPAILQQKLEQHLKQQPELLDTQQFFAAWPSTSASSPQLFLKLKSIRKEDPQQPGILEAEVDKFSVAGVVLSCDSPEGKFLIRIQRNQKTPEGLSQDPAWQPFNLEISGQLPDDAVGQFWELGCRRHASQLVLETARAFVKVPRPAKKPRADATDTPTATPTDTPAATLAATPAAETNVASDSPVASPTVATSPTPGKMEVVIKLNQFPGDVKTVDKGWKEFEVNTGSCIVTITAKPKAFATLEQAQQTYPLWLAAISGQMGEATTVALNPVKIGGAVNIDHSTLGQIPSNTAPPIFTRFFPTTGFRLDSPTIKVFEQKAKDSSTTEQPISLTSSLQGPTTGFLEVVVKINEFPALVRTVENGWKQFDVDASERVVTITVKPKVFKKLEQAQKTYPMWVAAISGQMGETTDRGFVLKEPNIQVFSRLPKDSAATELPQTKDNSEPLPATESYNEPAQSERKPYTQVLGDETKLSRPEADARFEEVFPSSQPSPPKTTPATTPPQQLAAEPKASPQPQAPPDANPMQRFKEPLKQQWSTKKPKNLGQNQQRDSSAPSQKQPTASAPNTESKSGSPRFSVKVNDQVFQGYDSVTLNKRVVRVDGVTVGQAKMVIVLGAPRTVQADGGVSQGRNQAVLASR